MKKFTLLELIIVISIIGILLTLLLPSLAKARRKAEISVCLSNLKQLSMATQLYTTNNNHRFPFLNFSGDPNRGRHWFGVKGTDPDYYTNVSKRPINTYLGYTSDSVTNIPIVKCPVAKILTQYKTSGSNYMGAQRTEHTDDLDTTSTSLFVSQVKNPKTMVLIGETAGWHYAYDPNNPWQSFTQFHREKTPEYSFTFVDGSVLNTKITGGMGISSSSKLLNFRNF